MDKLLKLLEPLTERFPFLKRLLTRELIAYFIVGVLTTVVNYILYFLALRLLGMNTVPANTLAWVGAVIFSFFLNRGFVFQSERTGSAVVREFLEFAGSRLITLLFEDGFLWLTVDRGGFNELWMKVAASVVVIILNYIFGKIIFKKKKEA